MAQTIQATPRALARERVLARGTVRDARVQYGARINAATLPAARITASHVRAHIARIALGTSPAAIAARNALTR